MCSQAFMLAGTFWGDLECLSSFSFRVEGGKAQSTREDGGFWSSFKILVPNLILLGLLSRVCPIGQETTVQSDQDRNWTLISSLSPPCFHHQPPHHRPWNFTHKTRRPF